MSRQSLDAVDIDIADNNKALRRYPNRGRQKKVLNGKLSGSNEFITDYIFKATGQKRDRKKVSSHIQVLKGFLQENPGCEYICMNSKACWSLTKSGMSLVAHIDLDKPSGRGRNSGDRHEDETTGWPSTISDRRLDYQSPHKKYQTYANSYLPPPTSIDVSASYIGPTIRRVQFAMTLRERDKKSHHIYSKIQSETAAAPGNLQDVKDWRMFYPQLATYYDRGQLECPIFLFDTSFNLMDEVPRAGSTLSIDLCAEFTHGAGFEQWTCHTTFYDEKGHMVDLTNLYNTFDKVKADPWRELKSSNSLNTTDARVWDIPLKSQWWVLVFTKISAQSQSAVASDVPNAVKQEEEFAQQYLQGISVMQEIWAESRDHNHERRRMAILLWRFGKARKGEAATTSWRRLETPAPVQLLSPAPTMLQPPMTLDSTLNSAIVPRELPLYAEYWPNHSNAAVVGSYTEEFLANPISEGSTRENTPSADYNDFSSFPSSESTSFPSSISSTAYPPLPSQGSSFHSQQSAYPSLASFGSHASQYQVHEFSTDIQRSYDSQDMTDQSQESFYQHAEQPLYEYENLQHDAHERSMIQDFPGGDIQLSYAQHLENDQDAPASAGETPLLAPRANMIPQHQLIQHPEHFDNHAYLERDLVNSQGISPGHTEDSFETTSWQVVSVQPAAVDEQLHQDMPGSALGNGGMQLHQATEEGETTLEDLSHLVPRGQVLAEDVDIKEEDE